MSFIRCEKVKIMISIRMLLLNIYNHYRSHIKYQFFFGFLAVIISVILIIGGVAYFYMPRIIEDQFYQNMDDLNRQIIVNIDNDLTQMEQTSLMLNFEDDLKMVLDVDLNTGGVDTSSCKNNINDTELG